MLHEGFPLFCSCGKRGSTYPPWNCHFFLRVTERYLDFSAKILLLICSSPSRETVISEELKACINASSASERCQDCFRRGFLPSHHLQRNRDIEVYLAYICSFLPCSALEFIQENTRFYFHCIVLWQRESLHNTCRNSCQSTEKLLAKLTPSLNGLCRDQRALC